MSEKCTTHIAQAFFFLVDRNFLTTNTKHSVAFEEGLSVVLLGFKDEFGISFVFTVQPPPFYLSIIFRYLYFKGGTQQMVLMLKYLGTKKSKPSSSDFFLTGSNKATHTV